jgi:hypothetical protein
MLGTKEISEGYMEQVTNSSFFLVAPPQISEEEMKHFEAEASFTVQRSLAAAVFLYLCMIPYLDALGEHRGCRMLQTAG